MITWEIECQVERPDTTGNAIQAQLNKAYNPIGINYTVEVDDSFDGNRDWCDKGNCDFNTGGSGLLNNDYTGVEARVIDAYINFKGEEKLDATSAYMFLIGMSKKEQGDEALQGKMNFSKQFGFLYSAASQNVRIRSAKYIFFSIGSNHSFV